MVYAVLEIEKINTVLRRKGQNVSKIFKYQISLWSVSTLLSLIAHMLNQQIYNTGQKSWDTKQVLPSPTYNVDNQVMLSLYVEKTRHFPTLIRRDGGYMIHLKCTY